MYNSNNTNIQNNLNINNSQPGLSSDSKTNLIRKRKRNEAVDIFNSYNVEQQLSSQSKCHLSKKKLFAIFTEERCFICKEELSNASTDTSTCSQCFRFFHNKCLNINRRDHKTETICIVCDKHNDEKCLHCNQQVNSDMDIQVCCELCGNLMHLECLSGIPLHILYKRKFYSIYVETYSSLTSTKLTEEKMIELYQDLETALKIFESKISHIQLQITNSTNNSGNKLNESGDSGSITSIQKLSYQMQLSPKLNSAPVNKREMLKNFLHNFFSRYFKEEYDQRFNLTNLVEKFMNLFYICKICLWNIDKKDSVNFFEFKIAKGTAFKRVNFQNMPIIHEIFAIATMIKNDNIDVNGVKSDNRIDRILDFFYLNRNERDEGYYLVKWKNDNLKYSFEYSKFVEAFWDFQNLKNDYEKRKLREAEYYEFYNGINSSLSKKINKKNFIGENSNFLTKSFKQEFKKIYSNMNLSPNQKLNSLNSLIDELETNHLFIINETKSIDEFRTNFITPLISKIIKFKTIYNDDSFMTKCLNDNFNPMFKHKILICYDNESLFKKWKEIFSTKNKEECKDELNIFNYRFKDRFLRILHEMFYVDLNKNNSTNNQIKKIIYTDENQKNLNSEEIFKIIENSITDFNHVKFDVILIDKNVLLFEYLNLFIKMNFDLIIMDFLEKDSVIKVKEIIKINSQKSSKIVILKSMDIVNSADDFEINFSNFLYNFYTANDYLILPPTNIPTSLKMLSKDKQFFPVKLDEMLNYLKKELKWAVFNSNIANVDSVGIINNSLRSNPYALKNSSSEKDKLNYFSQIREENILQLDLTSPRIVLNFIPVNLTQVEFLQYLSILRERKNIVLIKKQENKSDLIKNLSAFCSFPGLMIKYYLNKLEDKNLKLIEDNYVNRNKMGVLKNLIRNILYGNCGNLNNLHQMPGENCFNKIHVNVIYSEPSLDTESRLAAVLRILRNNLYKEFDKERKFIHFYSISSDYEEIFSHSQEQNVFIFFNVFLTHKITGKLFRRMFNCFKNRNLFIFQLFIENSIEQNLVEEFYISATDEIFFKENILINSMTKETKEIVLKKNLINLKFSSGNNNTSSMTVESFVFEKNETKKLDLSLFDGLIIVDNCIQIFTKNSNFIQNFNSNKITCEMEWDYILDEYFSEDKLTNSRDDFNYIQTRNKKQNVIKNNLQLDRNENIEDNIQKSTSQFKKQRVVLDDEEEEISEDIIRNSKNFLETPQNVSIISSKNFLNLLASGNNISNKNVINIQSTTLNCINSQNCPQIGNLQIDLEEINPNNNNLNVSTITDKNLIDNLVSENLSLNRTLKSKIDKSSINSVTNMTIKNMNNNCMDNNNGNQVSSIKPDSADKVEISADLSNQDKKVLAISNTNLDKYTENDVDMVNNSQNILSINSSNKESKNLLKFNLYLSQLETRAKNLISVDILQDVNNMLINDCGINLPIRNTIFSSVMKFGIDMDNLEEYINFLKNQIIKKNKVEVYEDILRFYIEYMLTVLFNCTSFQKDIYYQIYFFLGDVNYLNKKLFNNKSISNTSSLTIEIKKRIMILTKLKVFMKIPNEKIKEEIKYLMTVINKNLSSSNNLKPKFILKSDKIDVFLDYVVNFLKSVINFGYGEYKQIIDGYNQKLLNDFIPAMNNNDKLSDFQKVKFFVFDLITSSAVKNDFDIDGYLVVFMNELFIILENNLLDKF